MVAVSPNSSGLPITTRERKEEPVPHSVRGVSRVVNRPMAHGAASGPTAARRALGIDGRVIRALGGTANMHWLVETGGDRVILRRYGPWRSLAEVAWELELQRRLATDGWRVPGPLCAPAVVGDHVWAVMSWVPGQRRRPRTDASRIAGQRRRGHLLGELHLAMQEHLDLGPRPGWTRIDGWLDSRDRGSTVDDMLDDPSLLTPDAREVFKSYAHLAQRWLVDSSASDLPLVIVHGDLNPTNVLYAADDSVSIIDFDLARLDLVGAEFVWAPRRHPWAMVDGFSEVVSFSTTDRAALAPLSWIAVLDAVRRNVRWPSRPLPDSFASYQEFLATTPAGAYDSR